ncbi:MAG: MFS transporter [Methylacidiphilaceae bacterium]|nr:MFS transporter [Candidatus Methylacidiphilaceae bacterium]
MVAASGWDLRTTILRINLFQLFNTASFTLVNGVPMILFFREMGASDFLLGVVASLGPTLNLLQIPATRYLPRIGYRRLVVGGWSVRTSFIAGMALLPWAVPLLGGKVTSMMMLLLLFAYNASRGASLCGFLPWMTSLVPEGSRGWFLARDLFFSAAASVIILAGCFLLFRGHSSLSAFSWTFWGSFAAGLCSLWLLKRVPDVPIAAADQPRERTARKRKGDRGLLDLMGFNVLTASSLATGAVFWVPLLQGEHRWTPASILGLLASQSGLVLLSLVFLRNRIDRFGNRPALLAAVLAITTNFGLWLAIAARLLPIHPITLTLVVASWGIGFSCFQVGNVHLAMQLAPREGRSEYFARFSVVNSLALGAGPILWGAFLGFLPGWKLPIGSCEANPYVFLFLCLGLLVAASLFFLARLPGGRLPESSPAP